MQTPCALRRGYSNIPLCRVLNASGMSCVRHVFFFVRVRFALMMMTLSRVSILSVSSASKVMIVACVAFFFFPA